MKSTRRPEVIIVADEQALAETAARRLLARVTPPKARAAVCLTGGSGPEGLYRLLAQEPCRSALPWDRVHWFMGDEEVLRQPIDGSVAEHGEGCLLELDRHFGRLRLQRLAGAQVERHACPPPVVDHELERDIGLRGAVRVDVRGLAIILDRVVGDVTGPILPAHGIAERVGPRLRHRGVEKVRLLGPHGVGIES